MMEYEFDWGFVLQVLPRFGDAALVTVRIFVAALLISTTGALLLAMASRSSLKAVQAPLALFSWLFRGLPELIVLLFAYLALPQLGLSLSPFWAASCGLALVAMAYEYELFRAALGAVPPGQFEAARALGLRRVQLYRLVVLPQVLRIAITPYITFATAALKRTSVASAIAVPELMGLSRRLNEAFQKPFELMLIAMIFYAALSSLLMILEAVLDRRLQHGQTRASR